MGWRHLLTEGTVFRGFFEFRFIKSGLLLLATQPAAAPDAGAYRADGSLPDARDSHDIANFDVAASQVIPGYLRADLRRLARAANGKSHVTVYESPLFPSVSAHMRRLDIPYVTEQRDAFLGECRALGLTCMAAPQDFAADQTWWDATHAPTMAIGSFIRAQAAQSSLACVWG